MADITSKFIVEAQTKGFAEAAKQISSLNENLSKLTQRGGKADAGISKVASAFGGKAQGSAKAGQEGASSLGGLAGQLAKATALLKKGGLAGSGGSDKDLQGFAEKLKALHSMQAGQSKETVAALREEAKAARSAAKAWQSYFGARSGGGGVGAGITAGLGHRGGGGPGGGGPVHPMSPGLGGVGTGGGSPGGDGGGGPQKRKKDALFAPKDHSFMQGLLQGSLGVDYIKSGKGKYAQAAGVLAGRGLAGFAGAGLNLLSAGTQGSQALVNAAGSLPYGLGMLAAPVAQGVQAAHQEAATQASMSGLLPFIGGGGGRAEGRLGGYRGLAGGAGGHYTGRGNTESLSFLAQAVAQGGGQVSDLTQRQINHMFTLSQGFGVDSGSLGTLARAETLGTARSGTRRLARQMNTSTNISFFDQSGSIGPVQGGNAASTRLLNDARRLGLSGSEASRYVAQGASEAGSFNQTGIPFVASSTGDTARSLQLMSGDSMTGGRAAALAGGFGGAATGIARSGPMSADQLALFQAAGYNPEDPESYYRAQRALEDPEQRSKIMNSYMSRARALGQGKSAGAKAQILFNMSDSVGVGFSHTETQDIVNNKKRMSAKKINRVVSNEGMSPELSDKALGERSRANTFASQFKTGYQQNIGDSMGARMLPGVQDLDTRAAQFSSDVTQVGQIMGEMATYFGQASGKLIGIGGGPSNSAPVEAGG